MVGYSVNEALVVPIARYVEQGEWSEDLALLTCNFSVDALLQWLVTQNPLITTAWAMLAAVVFCWLASVVTGNCSYVDRLWSIVPAVYVWMYSHAAPESCRLRLMALLVTLWACRLTYNFYRKGGYNLSDEDYRWPIIRAQLHPIAFQVFNLTFIAFYQNLLLWMLTLPAYAVYLAHVNDVASHSLVACDYVIAAPFALLLLVETAADQQQWNFQTEKYRLINAALPRAGDYARGFLTRGLFRFSRHPNFFAEQSIWVVFTLFSVCASGATSLVWCGAGALQLLLLFQGSTGFTEGITTKKYPLYAQYQEITSRLIPLPPAGSMPPVDTVVPDTQS